MLARAYLEEIAPRRIDGFTRDEVCVQFQSRIVRLAKRLADRAGGDGGVTAEDLVGYGMVGLLEAFDRYDPTYRVDFGQFVEYRVRGAMIDSIRTSQGVTRRRRQIARQLAAGAAKARETSGMEEPGPREVARAMGLDLEAWWALVDALSPTPAMDLMTQPECLEVGGEWATYPAAPRRLALDEAKGALRSALIALPDRQREVVMLYYGRNCSQAEIGEALGVTNTRVCQILAAARAQLRAALGESVDIEAIAMGAADED